ncbi:DUF998 domain-containing protein [Streptomyces sp. SL13]|uniref:DUF998 domain-containing protein n=1 Tax=Streptantibioticus silvisoli TaxID=2705255 RepID=A0AA90K6K8_9ACTN|nr:DUF998 domain-containing protein [Streptantibioticus silvisoli]MDI5967828.1 DUF998 domain-containing protein [Streptantibioticus silvisoli]
MAVAANAVFVVSWLLAAGWQGPRYSVMRHSISDMYAVGAPGAAFLVVVFTLCGAAVIVFAGWSLWPSLRGAGRPAAVGAALLGLSVFGLGDLLSPAEREACRQAVPGCTAAHQLSNAGGMLDDVLSTVGVASLIAAGFFLAAAMKRLPAWRGWAGPTRRATIALIVLFVLDGVCGGIGLGGLCERLLAAGGALAIAALAAGVLRRTPAVDPGGRAAG